MNWFPECRDGGLDRYFHEALTAFSNSGMEGVATVCSSESSQVGNIAIRAMGSPITPLWARQRAARQLAREALGTGVEVVNVHFALYALAWLRSIPEGVPVVVHFHGPWALEMRAEGRSLMARAAQVIERWVYRRADLCITLSEAFRDLLHQEYGVPLDRIRVIPGGVDLARYLVAPARREARQVLGWPQERRVLLTVRRLARRMGLDLLVEAIGEVRKEFPEVLLLIAGKGAERKRLEEQIAAQALGEHVRLLGFVAEEDLPTAYAAADLTVVPTVALEGFGLVTVESLAAGTPVLGTAIGGTVEVLRPLQSDLLFTAATAEAMVEKIKAVLRGEMKLPDREACRSYARRYGWPEVAPRLLAVFREAVEGKR